MKKIFLLIVVLFSLCGISAQAATGDILRTLYTTDIATYVDGKQIKGYSLDGRMMICLEDLSDYGYAVDYDDSIRTLFVTKSGKADEDFNPSFDRGKDGGFAGYTYETEIVAFFNGIKTPTENIGGKLVAIAENLADVTEDDNTNKRFGTSQYFMTHSYDDSSRNLYLYSSVGELPTVEDQLENMKNMKYPNGDSAYARYAKEIFPTYDGGYLVYLSQSDAHHSTFMYLLRNNGEYIMLNDVFRQYGFLSFWGVLNIYDLNVSEDGCTLTFDGQKNRYETEEYSMDLRFLTITEKNYNIRKRSG